MSRLSLGDIANALGGVVRGDKVTAPGPEAVNRNRSTVTVWLNANGDIGVNCHEGQDPIATKDWVRERCGLPRWQPKPRRKAKIPPVAVRVRYLNECLKIASKRYNNRITFDQFNLIINDLKNIGRFDDIVDDASHYARKFGFTDADLHLAMSLLWRPYSADERGAIWNLTLEERNGLELHHTGCIDVDKAGRERARRDRYNAKRNADRQAKRAAKQAERRSGIPTPVPVVASVRRPSLIPSQEGRFLEEGSRGRGLRAEPASSPASVECHLHHSQIPGWGLSPPDAGCTHGGFERRGPGLEWIVAAKIVCWVATNPGDGVRQTYAAAFSFATGPPRASSSTTSRRAERLHVFVRKN